MTKATAPMSVQFREMNSSPAFKTLRKEYQQRLERLKGAFWELDEEKAAVQRIKIHHFEEAWSTVEQIILNTMKR